MAARPVARGGMFSTPKVAFSKETEQLLKVMMKESHLTSSQQRRLSDKLKHGQPLPSVCCPTSSAVTQRTAAVKVKKRTANLHTTSKRTKDTIEKLKQYHDDTDDYSPMPQRYNSSIEKERLHNIMAFGSEVSQVEQPALREKEETEIKDRFEEVTEEIEERRKFLEEMENLGQGKEYRSRILAEISQRVRELEVLDKKRSNLTL